MQPVASRLGGYRHGKRNGHAIKVVVPPEIAAAYRSTGRPLADQAYADLEAGFNARMKAAPNAAKDAE
jgi:hypothetical protein